MAWFWNLLVLQTHGVFPPADDFFEAVLLQQPQATEAVENVRHFFRVVLDLARPSEPWCFAAGSCFFRSCFTGISSSSRRYQFCEQPQATEAVFLGFQTTR